MQNSSSTSMLLWTMTFFMQGGESTREEMCQALLYYYPRTELTNCGSFPDPNTAHKAFLEKMFL